MTKHATQISRQCRECGIDFVTASHRGQFCSINCRKSHNNRRQQRGAAIYDLFMALRYERDRASEQKIWGAMSRLGETFRQEDIAERGGRFSWQDFKDVIEARPYLRATTILGRAKKK